MKDRKKILEEIHQGEIKASQGMAAHKTPLQWK